MVTVRLEGGPAEWAGKTLTLPRSTVVDCPPDGVGALLITDDVPPRGPDEDIDPRAIYEPDGDPADRLVWHFRGWFPSSPSDPEI